MRIIRVVVCAALVSAVVAFVPSLVAGQVTLAQDAGAEGAPPRSAAAGQAAPAQPATSPVMPVCGYQIGPPERLPAEGSGPVLYQIVVCFEKQGGASVIDPSTYLYYIQAPRTRPSQNVWVPFDEKLEQTLLDDFKRLWATKFLDDLSIEVRDYPFANGVPGKIVIYNMEERQRVKIVDFAGTKSLEQTKIDEKLKEENAVIRLDSFLDQSVIQKVKGIVREMLSEKGFQFAEVTHEVKPVAGGPKLVQLTFNIADGPKVKIQSVQFIGNKAISDGKLAKQMKTNKARGMFGFITGGGTYQDAKYGEDAEKVVEYYRDRGYIAARIGEPEFAYVDTSPDRKTRWMQLRVPVSEGERYRVGTFQFDGNNVVKTVALRELFKLKPGEYYSEKVIRKGLEKAREVYGSAGYFEFTAYPDLQPRDENAASPGGEANGGAGPAADGAASSDGSSQAKPASPASRQARRPPGAIVDVTLRIQEGKQYFINRITFVGNTTTRDNVIRRELRLYEGGVFNTEALKYSIKRLNQLAYFKPLEGTKDLNIDKTSGADNKVDVTLKLEEQNRNQITFGAGVSQWEGFFGQLSFQTSNFMGRGETFSVMLQAGSRAQNYQVGFTEPFLFDRNITGGIDVFKRDYRYIGQFTQSSVGGNIVFGFGMRDFTRLFVNYSYERTKVKDVNPIFLIPEYIGDNPWLSDMLLIGQGGSRTISKIVPSLVQNTVDNPIFPTAGRRLTASVDLAGLGGDTNFFKPMLEGVWYIPHTRRTSFGFRGQLEFINQFAGSKPLPIFERLFLGGEYSIRGFDIRSIGPRTPQGLVIGGTRSVLFNAEYLISIAGPVRLVLFFDTGRVAGTGDKFFAADEFKSSTGAEVRFFMPVLNVPFRLIMAYNPWREGVLDNNLQPTKAFTFRFAVGSTF